MKQQKGFTIIELIVVIAIIAVLAAIVLINVTSYISKGKDAAIKGNMSQLAVVAATHFESNGTYETLAGNTEVTNILDAINDVTKQSPVAEVIIAADYGSWCFASELKVSNEADWCTDSTGYKGDLVSSKCVTGTPTCQ